jgi:hypothetical protein
VEEKTAKVLEMFKACWDKVTNTCQHVNADKRLDAALTLVAAILDEQKPKAEAK